MTPILLWLDMSLHCIDCSMKRALVDSMHIGQTATYLAKVFNRPEPTLQMLARLLRDADQQWIKKGGRGRSAHHLTSAELANFLVAFMACPDSPAQALERLPHFSSLPYDSETGYQSTFGAALAVLLDRLASSQWEEARDKGWVVRLGVDISTASISEEFKIGDEPDTLDHVFLPPLEADDQAPMRDSFPYFSGLRSSVEISWLTLCRIAKVVLANEQDPLDIIREVLREK